MITMLGRVLRPFVFSKDSAKQPFEWVRAVDDEMPDLLCVVALAATVLYITYLRGNWLSKRIEACGLEPEVR